MQTESPSRPDRPERSEDAPVLAVAAQAASRIGARIAAQLRSLIALIAIIAVFSQLSPVYLTWNNLVTMTQHVSIFAIMAVGMTFVIVTAGIDLSVGAIAGFSGVVAGYLIDQGIVIGQAHIYPPVAVVVIAAIAAGALVGSLNGIITAFSGIPAFIVTLGMLYVARGSALLISNGEPYINLQGVPARHNTGFEFFGTAQWLHLPVEIYIMLVVGALGAFVAGRTIFGKHVYAVGGNERGAISAGIRVARVKVLVYAISGACAAIAGVIIASELSAADPTAATNYELGAIAAVVLGGTSLFGGQGTVGGSIAGAFVIGFLNDGLVLANVSEFWQMVATGLVIIAAVGLDEFQRRGGSRMRARRQVQKRRAQGGVRPGGTA